MDRRRALRTLAAAPAALLPACKSESGITRAADPAAPRSASWSPRSFSARQALILQDAMERIIPETTTPGAKSAGIGAQLESTLIDTYEEAVRKRFLAGLDALDRDAQKQHAVGFCECSPEQQTALLERLIAMLPPEGAGDGNGPQPFVLLLRELTIVGFCSSKLGATRVVGYEPIPAGYAGCVAEQKSAQSG
jgi:hypothetical protein